MLLSGCRVQHHTHSAAVANHATARTERDSIFVHDSVFVEYKRGRLISSPEMHYSSSDIWSSLPLIRSPDTVYLERWHTAYKDRLVHHTDTVQLTTTQTQTVQVPYVPKFYKYCTALSALLLFLFLLQVMLHLRRRFH